MTASGRIPAAACCGSRQTARKIARRMSDSAPGVLVRFVLPTSVKPIPYLARIGARKPTADQRYPFDSALPASTLGAQPALSAARWSHTTGCRPPGRPTAPDLRKQRHDPFAIGRLDHRQNESQPRPLGHSSPLICRPLVTPSVNNRIARAFARRRSRSARQTGARGPARDKGCKCAGALPGTPAESAGFLHNGRKNPSRRCQIRL